MATPIAAHAVTMRILISQGNAAQRLIKGEPVPGGHNTTVVAGSAAC
ncbi:MAG: hypothetical protein LC721_07705 [Actinobacteria bacterium]|nr:hypothetical protein [Actinomycetota bacterium]